MDDFFFTLFDGQMVSSIVIRGLALDGGHAHLQLCVGVLRLVQEILALKIGKPKGETLKDVEKPWEDWVDLCWFTVLLAMNIVYQS